MILNAIKQRRSIRDFTAEDVPQDQILEIVHAGQYAPTGMNTRAVEFVVVRDARTKEKLYELLEPHQKFVKEAPALIVPTMDTRKSPVAGADIAIATAFMMLQAASLGLGTVWKHIQPGKEEAFRACLGLPAEYLVMNVIPVGYPLKPEAPHQDSEFASERVHQEAWRGSLSAKP